MGRLIHFTGQAHKTELKLKGIDERNQNIRVEGGKIKTHKNTGVGSKLIQEEIFTTLLKALALLWLIL